MSERSDSAAFALLDPKVQRWIWKANWTELRDIQENAIPTILRAEADVVIASATASGKTEAAFLPIASSIVTDPPRGLGVLYISPLKALINDQFERLDSLFHEMQLPVHRWHGDVSNSQKQNLLKDPSGVLLITPESLEALFVRRGSKVPVLFQALRYVVIDELHAFIGSERGRQLQSLLHRIEHAVRRRIPRIALSATLGDMGLACDFLRVEGGGTVQTVVSNSSNNEVKLQIRGYKISAPKVGDDSSSESTSDDNGVSRGSGDSLEISQDLFKRLRGGRHLVFTNRRSDVELYTHLLSERCLQEGVANEFWPHHGSLDKSLREDAESALKAANRPATVIATTTLELGIDVGSVETITQLGPPITVASMRQRLGRSGRRGEAAILRIYVQEPEITPSTAPHEELRVDLIQSVAMVNLMVRKWYEPPIHGSLHLSTLVQQTLSVIAEVGGARADRIWRMLCEQGPFRSVTASMYSSFLRSLAKHELIAQTHDGEIVLGMQGERLVNHFDFYSAFTSPEEYRLVAGDKMLGTMPMIQPVVEGMHMIFAGRRWSVLSVDIEHKTIELKPARGGKAPMFGGAGAFVHDSVRKEMFDVLRVDYEYPFLDAAARGLLAEGRRAFQRYGLESSRIATWGKDVILFPWVGDRALSTLVIQLTNHNLRASAEGVAIVIGDTTEEEVRDVLKAVERQGPSSALSLAASVQNKISQKHHVWLDEELLNLDYASSDLDLVGAYGAIFPHFGCQEECRIERM
jgi:ATP-dependent Lhr-like helicase